PLLRKFYDFHLKMKSTRNNNQLPNNLPQLQNLIKRDRLSYQDEFLQQYRHYQSNLQLFLLKPSHHNETLENLVMFLAQVSHCYTEQLANFPQEVMDLLRSHATVLNPQMRMSFCRSLILLRNKSMLAPTDLLSLFFELLQCQDKGLRKFLQSHIITDIKNVNVRHKNAKLNTTLQNFMYNILKDSNSVAAKMSLDVMIQLYHKNIWNDQKTVNVITTACFSKITKVMVAALKFFLGSDEDEIKDSDSDSEDDVTSVRDVIMANKFNKKTRKRKKQMDKAKTVVKNAKNKKKPVAFNFSALHLIHDPQSFAERLLKMLETMNERFEVKLMVINLISRLIGVHQLFLFNFYPLLQRFLRPHQREVTKILQYSAQASHELIPPDVLEPVMMTIANNFIVESNSSEVMTVGVNAVREMCARCPLVMTEDLLHDLSQYRNYRDKSVMMATRSLIQLYRTINPGLLMRKDRGRPTEATKEIINREYGEIDNKDYIPGAEVLNPDAEPSKDDGWETDEEDNDGNDTDGSWIDVHHSSDDETSKTCQDEPNLTVDE
ncbi:SDAD1 (predicted), partial [Pycnogonum litorale]